MVSFLERVAVAFYNEYRSEIKSITFVFPNRRAGLFFQKHLVEQLSEPTILPTIITINDCFESASSYNIIDRTEALFRIYKIYKNISGSNEDFDTFFYWGEQLLSDFNEIDKYRVDARQILRNVSALKELDSLDYLSENQREVIARFWEHFTPIESKKDIEKKYVELWQILFDIYTEFNRSTKADNLATDGAIAKEVVDKLKRDEEHRFFIGKRFVFVGFNALNPNEEALFDEMKKRGKADFYWDYEMLEVFGNSGSTIDVSKHNLSKFPSALTIENSIVSSDQRRIKAIAVSSFVAQAKQTNELLEQFERNDKKIGITTKWIETAVVLPDENLLMPMLTSIPDEIENVNVTMGFPLNLTSAAIFLDLILSMQTKKNNNNEFYHQTVSKLLKHHYITLFEPEKANQISENMVKYNLIYLSKDRFEGSRLLEKIFVPQEESSLFLNYIMQVLIEMSIRWSDKKEELVNVPMELNCIEQLYLIIKRLDDVIARTNANVAVSIDILVRIVKKIVNGVRIPYEGEPLNGLQIMGNLETRSLDFERLIICSFNEDSYPQKSVSNSFIPYQIRKAFDLPVGEMNDAIQTYNFFRLIGRAKEVYFIYNSSAEGTQSGEISRFALQLEYLYKEKIDRITRNYDVKIDEPKPIKVKKEGKVMKALENYRIKSQFSASGLNAYLDCPLRFYFSYIENLKAPEELNDSVADNLFGTLIHNVLENIYKPYELQIVSEHIIDNINNKKNIDKLIIEAFAEDFFKRERTAKIELSGQYVLIAKVIGKYVSEVLKYDRKNTPFLFIASEKKIEYKFNYSQDKSVNLIGVVDRIDEVSDGLRVVDYKSGKAEVKFNELKDAFDKSKNSRPAYLLQTMYYSLLFKKTDNYKGGVIKPSILFIKDIFSENFSIIPQGNKISLENYNEYEDEFEAELRLLFDEIFNPNIDFEQTKIDNNCKYCDFKLICNKKDNE